jgi:hypothetical protein
MTQDQVLYELSEINMSIQILRNRISDADISKYLADRINLIADLCHLIDEELDD